MALKGSIKEFGLTEIFELIFQQKKEGVLTMIRDDEESILVLFKSGKIVQADVADHIESLLEKLNRASLLTSDQLGIIRYRTEKGNKSVEDLLVELEFLSSLEMMRLSRLFTEECLFGVFHWDSGEYQFEQQKITYNPKLITPLETQFLLMEGVRQIDEWPLLLKKISSREMVFECLPGSNSEPKTVKNGDSEDPFASFGELGEQGEKGDDWLTDQVAMGLSVQELIDQAVMNSFSVYQGLTELLKDKKIEIIRGDEQDRKTTIHFEKDMVIRSVLAVLILAISAGMFVISSPSINSVVMQTFVPFQEIKEFSKKNEAYFIRYALDLYYLKHHRYPDRLQRLFDENLFGSFKRVSFETGDIQKGWSYQLTSKKGDQFLLSRN